MKFAKRLFLVIALLFVAVFALFIRNGTSLSGYVSSYSFIPHDRWDVIDFNKGKVTLRAFDGNESIGTYSIKDDHWIWSYSRSTGVHQDFQVSPGWFTITFTSIQDPRITFTLARRLFARFPL
jgi:hypothetical protein